MPYGVRMAEPNFDNRTLFHGDNLAFLRGINSESIDLVATDPPFNKGKDFHATPDSLAAGASFHDRWSWERDVEGEWEDAIKDDWPAVQQVIESANAAWGRDMGAFLCYMGVRLLETHRVLKPTGSLYLHCDPTASHYLKAMLDAIFGKANFRNEIVWRIGWVSGFKTQKRGWIRNHDILLYYVKTEAAAKRFNKEYLPYPPDYVRRDGKKPTGKGFPIEDTWNCSTGDILDSIMIKSFSTEKSGYPTQKPVALYRRMIEASSNPGEVVLDPFCGCATTLIAAEQAERQWIGIDLWDEALDVVRGRVEKECQNLFGGDVLYSEVPPNRTDEGETASPPLKSKTKSRPIEPPGPKLTRDEMIAILLEQQGGICAGCDRAYDDPRIWHLDHKLPRSEGGANHISNRALLCPPCNQVKSDKLTLTGLRALNKKNGWMAG